MAPKIAAPSEQRYACRDCPARCCRVPWKIRFTKEEASRYLAEPWIRLRVGDEGARVLARGVLPMRVHERRLQCVFLDDDELCSLHKRFGHDYIPRPCQAFPFGFVRDGNKQAMIAQLSQLCPSIRDDYGEPIAGQLSAKLRQNGESERMTSAMSTRSRVLLSRRQYLRVAASWQEQLAGERGVADVLAHLYDQLIALDEALPEDEEKVRDAALTKALAAARKTPAEALEPLAKPSFHARALYGYLLGNLCYPSRVRQDHRVGGGPFLLGLRAFRNKTAWMRNRGSVDLLFVDDPVPLRKVRDVAPFLGDAEHGARVSRYLRTALERKNVFLAPRYIDDALLDLCFATVVVSRFARCRAASRGDTEVTGEDVAEGISVAELVLLSHVTVAEEGKTIKNVRPLLMSDRDKLRALLASEL